MPIIKSSSDLQRNFSAINDLAHETGEPIYITRNGESNLVVMDAEAFERTLDLQRRIYEHEMALRAAFEQSERELAAGNETSYEEYRMRRASSHVEAAVA